MKYLVLISHGGLAEGLKSSLAMFASDKIDQVLALGLRDGKTVDDFSTEVREALAKTGEDDQFLVLADIVGGSPLTTALKALDELGKLETAVVLGGMNLTMAITATVMKDILDGEALAKAILEEASTALQEFKTDSDDEGDDDI